MASAHPAILVLLTSGYIGNPLEPVAEGPRYHLLQKPFSREDLVRKAREILDA